MKFAGPYAWVQYTKGQPISPNNPNEGSVKRRNEKKRMSQRCAFIKVSLDYFYIDLFMFAIYSGIN